MSQRRERKIRRIYRQRMNIVAGHDFTLYKMRTDAAIRRLRVWAVSGWITAGVLAGFVGWVIW